MRTGLTLTKKEKKQIEKAIAKLDLSYQRGKLNPMVYREQRGKLLANLKRPMAERTNINLNQESFFRKRSNIHSGPAPVGFWSRNKTAKSIYDDGNYWNKSVTNALPQRKVSDNKVRSALINISDNGYWNSQDFQEALQISSSANQEAKRNNASYFQQAVMKSQQLGSAQNTLSEAGLWDQIESSEPVVKALTRLESTINYTVQRMYAVGISKHEAKDAIKRVAISSGQSMTTAGYSKEQAAKIVAMVIRGELGVNGAIAQVSGELNRTAENIAALNNGTNQIVAPPSNAREFQAAWQNNFDIHGNGTPTGVSMAALAEAKNKLEQQFDLSNNPVERNQLSQSISQIEQTLNQRQNGMNSVPPMTKKPGSSTQGPITASYNPRNNLRANQSLMQQTSAALNRGGPSIVTVVKDLFTIDGNMYLDWTAGNPISVANNGSYANASSNSDPSSVFASGVWTVFASNKNAIPTLKSIINSIGYALASPLWSDSDRAYLSYLKNQTEQRIEYLESGLLNLPNNTAVVQTNNSSVNNIQNLAQQTIQNNSNPTALSNMDIYGQYLNGLSLDELRRLALDTAYRYMREGITYVGMNGEMPEGDIMLQIAGSSSQSLKDALLVLSAGEKVYPGEAELELVILMELFHEGYDMSFLGSRRDLVELFLISKPNAKMILMPLLESIGFHVAAPNNNGLNQIINQTALNNSNQNKRLEQEARRRMNQQAKAAQQEQRRLAQQARVSQQSERMAQQERQAQAKAAQQADRRAQQALQAQAKAAQQADRRAQQALQAQAKAAQQADRRAQQAQAKAAQQAQKRANEEMRRAEQAAKAAQQSNRKAAQQAAKPRNPSPPPSMIVPIARRSSRFQRSRPSFSRGLRGSTSNTTSTRSHGGARFHDPRMQYRN